MAELSCRARFLGGLALRLVDVSVDEDGLSSLPLLAALRDFSRSAAPAASPSCREAWSCCNVAGSGVEPEVMVESSVESDFSTVRNFSASTASVGLFLCGCMALGVSKLAEAGRRARKDRRVVWTGSGGGSGNSDYLPGWSFAAFRLDEYALVSAQLASFARRSLGVLAPGLPRRPCQLCVRRV